MQLELGDWVFGDVMLLHAEGEEGVVVAAPVVPGLGRDVGLVELLLEVGGLDVGRLPFGKVSVELAELYLDGIELRLAQGVGLEVGTALLYVFIDRLLERNVSLWRLVVANEILNSVGKRILDLRIL